MKYLLTISLFIFGTLSAFSQWVSQSIDLNPGWNAIFFEVQPLPAEADTVFEGLPIESVWEWNRTERIIEFVQDPNDLLPRLPEWSTFFPEGSENRFLSNLLDIQGSRPYLVKVAGSSAVTLTVRGTPCPPKAKWVPNSFNFVGFHVASGGAPTFRDYFRDSPAHDAQQIFSLGSNGKWAFTSNIAQIEKGRGYWVKTKGASEFTGSIEVKSPVARAIDFGAVLESTNLEIHNHSSELATVTITPTESEARPTELSQYAEVSGIVPLLLRDPLSASAEYPMGRWLPFTTAQAISVEGGEQRYLELAIDRSSMGGVQGNVFQSLLEVTNGNGTQQTIGVSASIERPFVAGEARVLSNEKSKSTQKSASEPSRFAGLWVGSVRLDKVNWLGGVPESIDVINPNYDGANRAQPRPTDSEFNFRIILHMDATGNVKLLQKVIQVWENGTMAPDPDNAGLNIVDESGRYRLFSSEQAAADYEGATIRSNSSVPRRLSTAAYPLRAPLEMSLSGDIGGGGSLSGLILLSHTDPLNPFQHVYHPQHDSLDARYNDTLPPGAESFTIQRSISFEFTTDPPIGEPLPGWGSTELGGNYGESITGIYGGDRNGDGSPDPINISGTFTLRRVSLIGTLD